MGRFTKEALVQFVQVHNFKGELWGKLRVRCRKGEGEWKQKMGRNWRRYEAISDGYKGFRGGAT